METDFSKKTYAIEILKKDTLTLWDIRCLVEYLHEAFMAEENKHSLNIFTKVSDGVKTDIQNAMDMVTGLSHSMLALDEKIRAELKKSLDATDQAWGDMYEEKTKKYMEIKEQVDKLPVIQFPKIEIPYYWKEAMEMAERMASMTEDQRGAWTAFIETFKREK